MKHLWLVSILLKLCLILWDLQACACYRYNFERCRNCTTRKDVMCHIQQMPPTCFPGYDRDIWKDERKWPGAARDMRVSVDRQENGNLMVANFKWKPPYDSSVDELIGFKIQVTVQEEASMSHPVCLFANLSGTDWAQIKDVFDIDFIFNCVETTKLAKVMVYVISVPMPSREHKRIAKNIVMVPGFAWKPKIHVWTTFNNNAYQIHLWFTPLFPGAVYHKVQLHSNQLENSTNLEVPLGNFTFENVPCKMNYTVQIRPYDNQRALFDHYYSSKTVAVGDCPGTSDPIIGPPEPVASKLVTLISIPILLIIVGAITGFFFFKRDSAGCKLRRHYRPAANSETTPNNADCTIILPVYCDDSQQLRDAIHSLKSLLHSVKGCKAQFAEENLMEAFTSDYLKSNSFYQVAIVSTKSLIQIYKALQKNRSHFAEHSLTHSNGNLSHESQAFLNCVASLDNIHNFVSSNEQQIKKPILISFFPNIQNKLLSPDIQQEFVLTDVVDVDGNVQCIIRDAEVRKLINYLLDDDETLLQEEFSPSMPEVMDVCEKLTELYKLEMRSTPNKRLEESIKIYIGEDETHSHHHQDMVANYHIPSHFDSRCLDMNPTTWQVLQCNPKGAIFDPCDMHFTHQSYLENTIPLPRKYQDSGYMSLVQSEQDRSFLGVGNFTDFIPPMDSDTESIDNQSLCQKMLEFNQRNLTKWNAATS